MRYREIIEATTPGKFSRQCIFMAGTPGAGKSTIIAPIAKALGFVNLDADRLTVMASRKAGIDSRTPRDHEEAKRAWAIRYRVYDTIEKYQNSLLERGVPFIVNTTAADSNFIDDLRTKVESFGYSCWMIFIDVDLETALARNQTRDHLVPDAALTSRHEALQANLDHYRQTFDRVITIENNGQLDRNDPQIINLYRQLSTWKPKPLQESRDPHYTRLEPLSGRNALESFGKYRLAKIDGEVIVSVSHDREADPEDDDAILDVKAYVRGQDGKLECIGNGRVVINGQDAFFSNIGVVPEFRRRGVATVMYDQVEDMGYRLDMSPDGTFPDAQKMWSYRGNRF